MLRNIPVHPKYHRTKGSALITVTLIGLFVMLLAAALVNYFAIAEARAIADSLAKTRIYWASMGHINYSLSRVSREGLCGDTECTGGDDDGTPTPVVGFRAGFLRNYLNELNNDGDKRRWDYDDDYRFTLSATVIDGPFPTPVPDDGRVRVTITLDPIVGTPFDELNGIEQRIRRNLVVDVCLTAPCTSVPNVSSSGANAIEALFRN
jgi:hypothetical protein